MCANTRSMEFELLLILSSLAVGLFIFTQKSPLHFFPYSTMKGLLLIFYFFFKLET